MVIQMVSNGYKQTEVGVIPEDWDLVNYGDVFSFLSTATYSRADLKSDGPISYIHYGDIHTKWNHFLDVDKEELPAIDLQKAKRYDLVAEGDVVMADASEDYAGVGKSVEIRNLNGKKIISGLHTFLMRDRRKVFTDGFRGYIISNPLVKNQFDRLATGLKVYGVSKTNLKTIQIPRPSEEEQQDIAIILSDTDALIAALERLIRKKNLIKQGTMNNLLSGKLRLPNFSSKWTKKPLRSVLKVCHGKSQKSVRSTDGKYPILATGGEIGRTNSYLYNKPSVLIGRKGTIDRPQYIERPFWTIDTLFYTEISPQNNPKFLFYLFTQIDWASYNEASGVPSLNASTIESIEMDMPDSYEEQKTIAEILSHMDAEIENLQSRKEKLIKLKQGMMQQLLTGRIRLR